MIDKDIVRKGAILGGIFIIYGLSSPVLLNMGLITMGLVNLGLLVGILTVAIVMLVKWRRKQVELNRGIPYLEAWLHCSTFFVIAILVAAIFQITFHAIYPAYWEDFAMKMTDVQIEYLEEAGMMTDEGMEQLLQAEEDMLDRMNLSTMLKGVVFQCLGMIIFSALISLFVWKRPPKEPMPSISEES